MYLGFKINFQISEIVVLTKMITMCGVFLLEKAFIEDFLSGLL